MKFKKLLLIIAFIACIPFTVFADEAKVWINGSDEYAESDAVFDKSSNTLTLENYSGKEIYFQNFANGTELKIVLKGKNTIDSGKTLDTIEDNTYGIKANNNVKISITSENDGSLDIKHYEYGIYLCYGRIDITDANINSIENFGLVLTEGVLFIDNSNIYAKDNSGYVIDIENEDDELALKITNSNIDMDNVAVGIYAGSEVSIIDNCVINFSSLTSGIESNGVSLTIENCKINIDNNNSNKHLANGIFTSYSNIIINKSDITINNISNNNFVVDDSYVALFLFESGITSMYGNIDIKKSNIKIDSIYTITPESTDANKCGIIAVFGKLNIDSSEIHINVDDNGTAIGSVIDDTFPEDTYLTLSKNLMIVNPGYELKKFNFDAVQILWTGAYNLIVETIGTDLGTYEVTDIPSLVSTLSNKLDITGALDLKFISNDNRKLEKTVKTTGYMKELPTDIFTNVDGRLFKGWSLSKDGEIISELDVTENTELYAIWDGVENPKTNDNIASVILLGTISVIGLVSCTLYLNRKRIFN